MSEDQTDDKPYEASQRKLDEARKKGEFARSIDLYTFATYSGFLLCLAAFPVFFVEQFFSGLSHFLSGSFFTSKNELGGNLAVPTGVFLNIALGVSPLIVVPFLCLVALITVQRGFVFSASKLEPKLSRISPIDNLKNKFGLKGLFEFAKSSLKLCIFSGILFSFIYFELNDIIASAALNYAASIKMLVDKSFLFFAIVVVISLVVGGADYLFQVFENARRNKMSYEEVKKENKEIEGDPYLKQARKAKAEEVALGNGVLNVPEADVVIVNPTHYAVALKWSRLPGSAPECVAKGVDEVALKIREVAAVHNVPIHSDPPTARSLHATVEIGEEVTPEFYRAVAAAIRFSDKMRSKVRSAGGAA